MRARGGFTLWETAIVLGVLAVVLTLAAPAASRFGADQPRTSADRLFGLLHDARKMAIDRNVIVWLRVDPTSGRFRLDSTGTFGSGEIAEGTLELGSTDQLVTTQDRLVYMFRPTGAAFADSVLVRGGEWPMLMLVDPWSGAAHAEKR